MTLVGHVARIGEMINACKILVGKPEWRRSLRRTRSRCEHNIRMDLREIGEVDWMDLAFIGTSG
jgi:hypothetical protein